MSLCGLKHKINFINQVFNDLQTKNSKELNFNYSNSPSELFSKGNNWELDLSASRQSFKTSLIYYVLREPIHYVYLGKSKKILPTSPIKHFFIACDKTIAKSHLLMDLVTLINVSYSQKINVFLSVGDLFSQGKSIRSRKILSGSEHYKLLGYFDKLLPADSKNKLKKMLRESPTGLA